MQVLVADRMGTIVFQVIHVLHAGILDISFHVVGVHLIRLNEEADMKERALGLPKGFRYIT